jgi:hypothetical protein
MEFLIVFLVAFVTEMLVTWYTVCVSRRQIGMAMIASGIVGLLGYGITIAIIENGSLWTLINFVRDHPLVLPSVAGEILGTGALLKIATFKR